MLQFTVKLKHTRTLALIDLARILVDQLKIAPEAAGFI